MLPKKILNELDDWANNLSNNLIIFDKPAAEVTKALDKWVPKTTDLRTIESALYKNTTNSPVFRYEVRTEADAKNLAALKNAISDSNESQYPTKLIVENSYGKLDPALYSRARTFAGRDLAEQPIAPTKDSTAVTAAAAPKAEPMAAPIAQAPVPKMDTAIPAERQAQTTTTPKVRKETKGPVALTREEMIEANARRTEMNKIFASQGRPPVTLYDIPPEMPAPKEVKKGKGNKKK